MNTRGRFGLGDTAPGADGANEPGDALPTVSPVQIAARPRSRPAANQICTLLDHRPHMLGYNADGQLGLGDERGCGSVSGEMGDALPAVYPWTARRS